MATPLSEIIEESNRYSQLQSHGQPIQQVPQHKPYQAISPYADMPDYSEKFNDDFVLSNKAVKSSQSTKKAKYSIIDSSFFEAPQSNQTNTLNVPNTNLQNNSLGDYNSNHIYANNIPHVPAQQYLNSLPQNQQTVMTSSGPMIMPRQQSFNQDRLQQEKQKTYYNQFVQEPRQPAPIYSAKDASVQDTVPMKEEFHYPRHARYYDMYEYDDCMSILQHIESCPYCSRMYRCDNRLYLIMIAILLFMFLCLLFLIYKKSNEA